MNKSKCLIENVLSALTFFPAKGYYSLDRNLKTDYDVEKNVFLVRLVDTSKIASNIS